jgi:hypothetical protein
MTPMNIWVNLKNNTNNLNEMEKVMQYGEFNRNMEILKKSNQNSRNLKVNELK